MANIQFENVERTFHQGGQDFLALQGVNLEVADREFVAIVGPSGCGKTTCMRMAAGLEHLRDPELRTLRGVQCGAEAADDVADHDGEHGPPE